MKQKSYQTIDPILLETLQLNEKRIHYIMDILHGRNLEPKLPQIYVYQPKSKTERKGPIINNSRVRISSMRKINSPQNPPKKGKSLEKSPIKSMKSVIMNDKEQSEVSDFQIQKKKKKERLYLDYGRNKKQKIRPLNMKDLYRLETYSILEKFVEVSQIEASQKQLRRLKRRYKHLHTFDRHYYRKLNEPDLLLI